MKLLLGIFFLLLSPSSYSQQNDSVSNIIKFRTVLVQTKYKKQNDDKVYSRIGGGFIIGRQYLATCYHIYKSNESEMPIEIKVMYKVQSENKSEYKYLFATLNNTTPKQYDFKTHKFSSNNPKTDFIILSLEDKIEIIQPTFRTENLKQNEKIIVQGSIINKENGEEYRQIKTATFEVKFSVGDSSDRDYQLIGLLGDANKGFSGSPAFDSIGNVIGFLWGGLENDIESYLDRARINRWISETTQQEILTGYRDGKKLTYVVGIKYLLTRYIESYFP